MIRDEFHRALIAEQYGTPTKQWHPSLDDLIAAGERVERLEGETSDRKTA